jgi:NADH:ubiquinone oxidoreductase subunit K
MTADALQILYVYSPFVVLLFVSGLYCMLGTYNLVRVLIGAELCNKAVTLLIILAGYACGNLALAQSIVITLLAIEVVLVVVAGGVIICLYRQYGSLDVRNLRNLKG